MPRILVVLCTFAVMVGTFVAGAAGAVSTVVVTPSTPSGWVVAPDGTVPYAFASGPASSGAGSLQFGPVDGTTPANKLIVFTPLLGVPASDLTAFSYDFFIDSSSPGGAADAQHLYLNLYVDVASNGIGVFGPGPGSSGFYDCRYDLVPTTGTVNGWTTASFTASSSWTNIADRIAGCPLTLSGLAGGDRIRWITLNGGQSTASDAGLKAAFDKVVVQTATDTTTYDFEPAGACATSTSGTTITLLADCVVTSSFVVPDGYTLDGNGNSITAQDPPGGHFVGGVVENGGDVAHVTDIEITASGLADVCDSGADRLRGILFDGAGGSITDVDVHGVRQGLSGCQEGNAIEVRNFDPSGDPAATQLAVTISGNAVSDYQKNGITANGNVAASITGNTVTGDGPVTYIAQNGIQIGFGATALIRENIVSGNAYTPTSFVACGLLYAEAAGVRQQANDVFANERNLCNFGRGGGTFNAAS